MDKEDTMESQENLIRFFEEWIDANENDIAMANVEVIYKDGRRIEYGKLAEITKAEIKND